MGTLYPVTHSSFLNGHPKRIHTYINKTLNIKTRFHVVYSKKSAFQDFQGYANPSRLLPATEPEFCTNLSLNNILKPLELEGAECLFKVRLNTSGQYGSGLSNSKAGILLCLVDEKGDSVLQRIPAILNNSHFNQRKGDFDYDSIHFQRGSVDEFTFRGPKLQKIEALWIGLESGQWRPGGVNLIVTCQDQPISSQNSLNTARYICTEYIFEVEDILLGEGGDSSMAEFRPSQIKEFAEDDIISLSENFLQPSSTNDGKTKDESMREYANLKSSLLLYDILLVLSGASFASYSLGRNSGTAFLVGGTVGFFYLFLLQRSVDRLQAPGSKKMENTGVVGEFFGKFEGPVSTLVIAFVFAVVAVKYGSSDNAMVLTPKEVLCGMLGFLVCKVAVVLAAFKTLPIGSEENK